MKSDWWMALKLSRVLTQTKKALIESQKYTQQVLQHVVYRGIFSMLVKKAGLDELSPSSHYSVSILSFLLTVLQWIVKPWFYSRVSYRKA